MRERRQERYEERPTYGGMAADREPLREPPRGRTQGSQWEKGVDIEVGLVLSQLTLDVTSDA
jgi:hypothetical protein